MMTGGSGIARATSSRWMNTATTYFTAGGIEWSRSAVTASNWGDRIRFEHSPEYSAGRSGCGRNGRGPLDQGIRSAHATRSDHLSSRSNRTRSRRIPLYMIPDVIVFRDSLPTTSTDKVANEALKELV